MRVSSLHIKGFRSISNSGPLELSSLNVLVGPNNSGKSAVLRALYAMQKGSEVSDTDRRLDSVTFDLLLTFVDRGDNEGPASWRGVNTDSNFQVALGLRGKSVTVQVRDVHGKFQNSSLIENTHPIHFVLPHLSRRKTSAFSPTVTTSTSTTITNNYSTLSARLSQLVVPSFPGHDTYQKACKQILGFDVVPVIVPNGQVPGVYLSDGMSLTFDQLGEGVTNIVGMLVDLATAQGKLFLIEEPENDLHPKALKALLDLIVSSSESNQFVISTHSHIVMTYLAGHRNSALYSVDVEDPASLPHTTSIKRIEPTKEARMEILRELGYELSDLDLWEGWVFFEESSAERIARDFLIPWFVSELDGKFRTVGAGGADDAEADFNAYRRLALFTHLDNSIRDRTWVILDGDEKGVTVRDSLRKKFGSWPKERFQTLSESDFEKYYPHQFRTEVDRVLAIQDSRSKRAEKNRLFGDVLSWLSADRDRGKAALKESASEVIKLLEVVRDSYIDASNAESDLESKAA